MMQTDGVSRAAFQRGAQIFCKFRHRLDKKVNELRRDTIMIFLAIFI